MALEARWADDIEVQSKARDAVGAAARAVGSTVEQMKRSAEKPTLGSATSAASLAPTPGGDAGTRLVLPMSLVRPRGKVLGAQFVTLAEWEGVVGNILPDGETFTATLQDVNGRAEPEEYAEFFLEDVREDDRPLLRPGAVFRWVVGKREDEHGTLERTSRIVFRRLPAYTASDFERARSKAAMLVDAVPVE